MITSAANPVVKLIRRLGDRKTRRSEQSSLVWGIQPVIQAAEARHPIRQLIVAPDLIRSEAARSFVAESQASGVEVSELSAELFTRIADRDHPTGLAAIIATTEAGLNDLVLPDGPATIVALDRIANPGNLGTILRTAEATGATAVILVGPTTDVWDPATIKASMGAVFTTPAARSESTAELISWAQDHDFEVVTTAARAEETMWQTSFAERTLLLMGSEQQGLDDAALAAGDRQVAIPMVGTAESLNLASATSVLLYEVWRQRAASTGGKSGTTHG